MEDNIINKKSKNKFLFKIIICFALLLMIFFTIQENLGSSVVLANDEVKEVLEKEKNNKEKFIYLSDIPYIEEQSSVGWGNITLDGNLDKNYNNGWIALKVNGKIQYFPKGISAHANSTLVYDISDYNYDYLTAYLGIDASRGSNGNGVKFAVATSVDGKTWTSIIRTTDTLKGDTEALFIKVDVKEANYIKLYANSLGSNAADHSVYADAKLIKEDYIDEGPARVDFIKTIEEYDEIIKSHEGEEITGEYELALLQKQFVEDVGYDTLQFYTNLNQENKETILWLMTNIENLRLYVLGGKPTGSYLKSLDVLNELYNEYKQDFEIKEVSKYGTVLGDLYKKMAITLSLTHSSQVALWMQPSNPANQSDAVTRYQIYKDMHKNGNLKVNDSIDITKWFENYSVEEMRFVMNNIIDDEEILWLNEYTQSQIEAHPNQAWTYLTPHPYMAYVWPNYSNPVFHDPEKKDYWDEKYNGIFSKYGVTYSTDGNMTYKVWMNFRNEFGTGAVCGGISKTGSNIRTSHGIPAAVIGQPGHAAIIYYGQDANGYGYWNIDNDVSGWTLSEKGERMLLGWGNASYSRGYSVVYMTLAQEALNDYENFEKCEKTIMAAKAYQGDVIKQEALYREALEIQHINIDAWYGLIELYKSEEYREYLNSINKSREEALYNLAEEVTENLKYFPLPMNHLLNLIAPELTSVEYSFKYTLLLTNALTEGSKFQGTGTYEPGKVGSVYQPSITRTMANYLLGKTDKTLATFSFDGEESGKIILSSRFDGNGIRWDYSLDGKQTWNEVSFTAEEEHKLQLSQDEINSITEENDIYIHIVGTGYEENNLYKIDITKGSLPANIFANDLENRMVGVNLVTEWRYTENDTWTSYSNSSPDLTGNKSVQIRQGATGTALASDTMTNVFTEDNQPDTRKYIPVSHLSIAGVSTEATNNGGAATYSIDANYNTRWHSAWNGTDTQRYIIVKLDKPVYLSAVEFVPAGGGNRKNL